MKYVCPLITVENMSVSRHFYESILDQKVKHDFGENITFEGDFAIHLKSHYAELIEKKTIIQPNNSFELYFEHDEIDDFAGKLKSSNVEFIHGVREQPWRQKVVRFYDPDKNIIEVGESLEFLAYRLFLEGKSNEEISRITNMPMDFVIDSIKLRSNAGNGV